MLPFADSDSSLFQTSRLLSVHVCSLVNVFYDTICHLGTQEWRLPLFRYQLATLCVASNNHHHHDDQNPKPK